MFFGVTGNTFDRDLVGESASGSAKATVVPVGQFHEVADSSEGRDHIGVVIAAFERASGIVFGALEASICVIFGITLVLVGC